jgi:hypothetical protein
MLAYIGWIVQYPAIDIRHDKGIPVRQVKLVHVVAVGSGLELDRDIYAETHAESHLLPRVDRPRQVNRQPLSAEIVIELAAIHKDILEREAVSQVGFHGHDYFVERSAGLVGVVDRFIRSQLVTVIIEQHVHCVLRA